MTQILICGFQTNGVLTILFLDLWDFFILHAWAHIGVSYKPYMVFWHVWWSVVVQVKAEDMDSYAPKDLLIVTTGSQVYFQQWTMKRLL